MLKNKTFDILKKQLNDRPIILLGELHGADANLNIIKLFVQKFNIDIILFELEKKWNNKLINFTKGKKGEFWTELSKEEWIINCGLIGKKYLKFFEDIFNSGKKIYFIRKYKDKWNDSDEATAKNILEIYNKNKDKKILAVMGNLHVRKKDFKFKENKNIEIFKPVGLHLKDKTISILIKYGTGKIKNFKLIKIKDNNTIKILENRHDMLLPSKSKYFDYYFLIRNTKPIL